ncbi:PTS lactose/cellobiose transporter subunit IIA [Paenibacillus camerounensis]|uniref:PTS lactose/cellobiose transporter subunit IIA n=1 Tax=Paenibacillus camerounensis TaxID=1243663 RepID=UPI000AF32C42|nr:PTS lactose/cellobiose transporter subunit IIA [Paenibacillus camerounensis]
MDYLEKIMTLIAMSGSARSKAMEALMLAKQNEMVSAGELLDAAATEIRSAHKIQTQLIQEEAGGTRQDITLLMIHAQDHLMNAMTVKDMAKEFISLYERLPQTN